MVGSWTITEELVIPMQDDCSDSDLVGALDQCPCLVTLCYCCCLLQEYVLLVQRASQSLE